MAMIRPHQGHPLWLAALLHRISGVALALFLPAHFYVLGRAIESQAALDGFLSWTAAPVFKATETALVFLLAVHMAGGLRLLALEFLPWSARQKTFAAAAAGLALLVACGFFLNAV